MAPAEPITTSLTYGLEAKPPAKVAALVGLQHVLAMFVGVISVPLLVAQGLHLELTDTAYLVSMGLLTSGIGTLVQVIGFGPFGSRLLSAQGTSFAFLAPLLQAGAQGGLPLMFGMCLVGAPVELVLAFLLPRLRRVFTPLISGMVVLLIGLSLLPVSLRGIAAGLDGHGVTGVSLGITGLTLLSVLAFNALGFSWARMTAVPLALVFGTVAAVVVGGYRPPHAASDAGAWLVVPTPFRYGLSFDWGLVISFLIPYALTALETVGDVTATSQISGEPVQGPTYWRRLRGAVAADSLNSAFAALLNSFPSTTFAQNNGLIQMTGVASRRVGIWVGFVLCACGLLPGVSRTVAAVPGPVLGPVTLLLFGFVATAGLRILGGVRFGHRELLILSTALGTGLGVGLAPEVLAPLPGAIRQIFHSGVTTGALTALLLNILLPGDGTVAAQTATAESDLAHDPV